MANKKIMFQASKYKATEDQDGEVKVVLVVPQTEAHKVLDIPVQKLLSVTVEVLEPDYMLP